MTRALARMRLALLLVPICLGAACATPTIPTLPTPTAALSNDELDARTRWIEERLDASRRHGQLWQYGWIAAETGGLIFGTAQAATADDSGDRTAGIVTAVLSVGGYVYQWAMPLRVRHGADAIRALPGATHAEKVRKLEKAQELLAYDAERATVQVNWLAHAANAAVALASAVLIYEVGDDSAPAISTGLQVLVGGEVQFWTEPADPRRAIRDYVREFGLAPQARGGFRLGSTTGGLGFRYEW